VALKDASSARKGKAVEQLVAAMCVLATGGELNALTALVDDEGVDIGFKRKNGTRVLDVQVKARFSDADGSKALREKGRFDGDVRLETFKPREDLYMLYLAIDGPAAEIEHAWLVPSTLLAEEGIVVNKRGKEHVRIAASAKADTDDKWRPYRYTREEFPQKLLEVVAGLEPEEIPDEEVVPDDDEDE
jgi:hypothetical protein